MIKSPRRRVPPYLADIVVVDEEHAPRSAFAPPSPPSPAKPRVGQPHNQDLLDRLVRATPARVASGRTGTRYRTGTYLGLRGDHAIAKDAVYGDLAEDVIQSFDGVVVTSRCTDREHYLLHPNDGRRLSDESRERLGREGTRDVDVQVILADGLAAPALRVNGPQLLPALQGALQAGGISVGRPIVATLARVGLQDDIGVLLGARATIIALGERPGLGTGDSLSIYLAVGPRLDQDNAEKNCVSNVRPRGLAPEHAAEIAADLMQRGLDLGRGGLDLA